MSRRSTVLLAFLVLVALLLGAAHFLRFDSRSSTRSRLADALGPCRFAEGRMTGGFDYAPFDPSNKNPKPSKELRAALRDLQDNAGQGLAKLIDGKSRQAVAELEQAIAAGPDSAAVFSDLAAAYLEDARKSREPYSLVKALESAEKAVALAPNLPEARFNRAVALESFFLDQQARSAWQAYLQIDSQSGWAAEARKRLRALPETGAAERRWQAAKLELDAAVEQGDFADVDEVVTQFPQASREYAEEVLLGTWAETLKAGRTQEAQQVLKKAYLIGSILRVRNGDRITADTVTVIEEATRPGLGRRMKTLEEGHLWYLEGLRLYQDGRLVEAREKFLDAERHLAGVGSPFALLATLRLAVCEMQSFDYPGALAKLDRIRFSDAGRSYPSLMARSQWTTALIKVIQARPTDALAAYRRAYSAFDSIGERENCAVVSALTAESLWSSGDLRGALPYNFSALKSLRDLRNPVRRQVVLEGSGLTALSMGEPLAALAFQQEAFASLSTSRNAAAWIYCLRRRALIEIRAGRAERARRDLAEARSRLAEVHDTSLRDSLLGDILGVESQLHDASDPRKAVDTTSEVIAIYRNTRYQKQLAFFLARRARAQAALGKLDLAEDDYAEAIRAIARQHEATSERELRTWFLAASRSIFQEMIELQAHLGKAEKALSYAESGRAQLFREQASRGPEAMSAADISQQIPRDVALVEFWATDRQLLSWVVRRGSITQFSTKITAGSLSRRIDRFRQDITARDSHEAGPDARELFDILIRPLLPALEGAKTVVIVPDGDLYRLPFAALQDSANRYLIERYTLAVDPSATLYVQALAREKILASLPLRSVLVFGDPDLDREVLQDLPQLPQARREAVHIASFYPEVEIRMGAQATKRQFLTGLATSDVIHFAGHAVVNPTVPSLSFLALAPSASEGDSGILYARDLYGLPAPAARLVILSACSTMRGDTREGEGLAGLARPFLASGVPTVVGSLWRVDDRATAALLIEFHQRLPRLGSAEALRQAQLAASSSSDSEVSAPASWAGFQVIGAGSLYLHFNRSF